MAKPTVYLETTIIGYGASRPSRDLVVAARQQITREWLATAAHGYEVFVSQPVIHEASAGDDQAARERLAVIKGIPLLAVTDEERQAHRQRDDAPSDRTGMQGVGLRATSNLHP